MPLPFHALVPCGACGCHVRLSEKECPHCGALVRDANGALPRTKVAALMGLTAALLQPLACGGDVVEQHDISSDGGPGGTGGTSGQGTGGGDIMVASAYGVGPTTSFTTIGNGGTGGTGGTSVDGGKGGTGVDGGKGGSGGAAGGTGGTGGRGAGGGDIMVASAYGVGPTTSFTVVGVGGNGGEGGLGGGGNGGTKDGGVDGSKGRP